MRRDQEKTYTAFTPRLEHATAKAYLLVFPRFGEIWVPKSQCRGVPSNRGDVVIEIADWFVEREGLADYADHSGSGTPGEVLDDGDWGHQGQEDPMGDDWPPSGQMGYSDDIPI